MANRMVNKLVSIGLILLGMHLIINHKKFGREKAKSHEGWDMGIWSTLLLPSIILHYSHTKTLKHIVSNILEVDSA